MAIAAALYVHSKLAQVDDTAQQPNWNITGVRFWTEEEWLAHRLLARTTIRHTRRVVQMCAAFAFE